MRRLRAAALLAAALALGLLLPVLASWVQDRAASQQETSGIHQVDLSLSSSLTMMQKLQMMSGGGASAIQMAEGRVQTTESLSKACWTVLGRLLERGAVEMVPENIVQSSQTPMLVSAGGEAFLMWEVLFQDGDSVLLQIFLDDETGLPLGLGYYGQGEAQNADVLGGAAYSAASVLAEMAGLALQAAEEVEPAMTDASAGVAAVQLWLWDEADVSEGCGVEVCFGDGMYTVNQPQWQEGSP